MRIVSEEEFNTELRKKLNELPWNLGCVLGPGRSGAIAAVYTSHILGIPFIPYGQGIPEGFRPLIIDTATESGATLRKAAKKYKQYNPVAAAVYQEPPRVAFWYEAPKPQRYKHERKDFTK